MKKQKQAVCPGCSRHCTADAVRCKRGRTYFAKLAENAAGQPCVQRPAAHHRHKWEKHVSEGGAMWHLLSTGRKIKKALYHGKITENGLVETLTAAEQVQLVAILRKLNGCLE